MKSRRPLSWSRFSGFAKSWRLHVVVLLTIALSSCDVGVPTVSSGQWHGTYTCAQGLTGLRLDIGGSIAGKIPATFNFFPVASNPDVESGSFMMQGEFLNGDRLVFTAGEWIDQPPTYRTVDLDGVFSADGETYSGAVVATAASACTTFFLSRADW